MSSDNFETEVKNRHEEMIGILESIDVDALKSEGVSLSFGGKTFKFTDLEVINDEDKEEKIRSEYKGKLNVQQQRIRDKINSKINQLLVMHQQKQKELDRKEEQLKLKYSQAAMMPEIAERHLIKGLSVVKGSSNNELIWVYRGVYNPRFIIYYPDSRVDNRNKTKKPIPQRLVNRMKQDMLIIIRTKDRKINSIVTRKVQANSRGNMVPFPHYHQQTSNDCWGSWKYRTDWSTPDDIMNIAKEAESILETINQGSLAEHNPTGLPRINTIIKAVDNVDEIIPTIESTNNENISNDEDVWSSL